jgi:hypothetical protein
MWSLSKESALRDLVASGVPYSEALMALSDATIPEIAEAKARLISEYTGKVDPSEDSRR